MEHVMIWALPVQERTSETDTTLPAPLAVSLADIDAGSGSIP